MTMRIVLCDEACSRSLYLFEFINVVLDVWVPNNASVFQFISYKGEVCVLSACLRTVVEVLRRNLRF